MDPIFKVLDELSFIMESMLQNCFGDAKYELQNLAHRLENDPAYAIEGREKLATELREALSMIRGNGRPSGCLIVIKISRNLWKAAENLEA
jgi:hypothetical protein